MFASGSKGFARAFRAPPHELQHELRELRGFENTASYRTDRICLPRSHFGATGRSKRLIRSHFGAPGRSKRLPRSHFGATGRSKRLLRSHFGAPGRSKRLPRSHFGATWHSKRLLRSHLDHFALESSAPKPLRSHCALEKIFEGAVQRGCTRLHCTLYHFTLFALPCACICTGSH